jgi:hypothetical protein
MIVTFEGCDGWHSLMASSIDQTGWYIGTWWWCLLNLDVRDELAAGVRLAEHRH